MRDVVAGSDDLINTLIDRAMRELRGGKKGKKGKKGVRTI